METLTRAEFEVLFDIHYGNIGPEDEPEYAIIKSLEEKGFIIKNYEEGKVIEYVETTLSMDLFDEGSYDDWETELRYRRSLEGKG